MYTWFWIKSSNGIKKQEINMHGGNLCRAPMALLDVLLAVCLTNIPEMK